MWSVLCMWVQVLSPRECCMWVKSVKWMWCEEMRDVKSVEWVVNVSVKSVLAMTSTYKQQTHTTTCSKYISKHVTWWNMRATHCVCEHSKWTQGYTHENAHATHKTNTRHTHMLICTKTNNIQHILQRTSARQHLCWHLKLSKIYLCICLQFTHMHENNTYHNNTQYKQAHRQTMHDAYAYTYLHTLVWPHLCKYTHRWYVPAQTQPHMCAHKYAIELWELM